VSGTCNAVAPCYYWPSPQSSRAFCDAMTSNVTLPIFVRPRTFVKLLSVKGRSSNFRPLDLHPSVHRLSSDVCQIIIELLSCVLPSCCHVSYILSSYVLRFVIMHPTILSFRSTSILHHSFPLTHRILQTVRCVKTL
jgi:hypothetical protein